MKQVCPAVEFKHSHNDKTADPGSASNLQEDTCRILKRNSTGSLLFFYQLLIHFGHTQLPLCDVFLRTLRDHNLSLTYFKKAAICKSFWKKPESGVKSSAHIAENPHLASGLLEEPRPSGMTDPECTAPTAPFLPLQPLYAAGLLGVCVCMCLKALLILPEFTFALSHHTTPFFLSSTIVPSAAISFHSSSTFPGALSAPSHF